MSETELEKLKDYRNNLRQIVASQAEDYGIWFVAETITEDYLQKEIRKLHYAIEADI